MTALARTGLRLTVFFLALFALIYLALFFIFHSARFRIWIQAELSELSGSEVRVADLHFRPPFSIVADGVEVSKAREFFFRTSRLTATINPFDLRSRTLHRLDVEKPVLQLDLEEVMKSTTKTSGQIALRQLNVQDGTFVLKKGEAMIFELPKINLNAQNFNLGGQTGVSLHAEIPQLNGEMDLGIKGQFPDLESEVVIHTKKSHSLFDAQNPNGAVPEMLRLRATIRLPENQKADVTIESQLHNFMIRDAKLTGSLNSRIEIDPDYSVAMFSGQADVADFPSAFASTVSRLPNGKAAIIFTGAYATASKKLSVKSFQLTSHLGTGEGDGEIIFAPKPTVAKAKLVLRDIPLDTLKALFPAPLNRWIYQGWGQIDVDLRGVWNALEFKGVARSDGAQLRGDNLTLANLSFAAPFEWSHPALRVSAAKLTALKLAYGEKERWQGAAERMQASATLEFKANEPWKISGRFESAGGKFSSPDNSKVGENLSLDGDFAFVSAPAKHSTSISGKFRAESGELLWGKFFGDLKTQQPRVELNTDYFRDEDRLDCHRCNLSLANIGAIDVSGFIERLTQTPELHLQARSTDFLPGGFFEFVLRQTFNRQYPVLDKLAVAGQLAFQCQIQGKPNNLVTQGELLLKAGELRAKSNGWRIGPIALNLPFQVFWSEGTKASSDKPRTGVLSIEKAEFRGQSLGPITTAISLSNNALQFPQPIRAGLFGGEINIGNLAWPDIVNNPKQVSFSVEMKRLQLQQLTQALDWPRFNGTMTGSIPQVRSVGNTLNTNGEIQAELFGGQLRMGKLEIENPFSALASIRLDARLAGVELEQVSKTFAFGRISGILEGTIDDLVITDGQPSQFRADLHSVDRGTEQRISVEALNKITVLSSGENAGALYSGLAGFFDSFGYSKLGFKASLKNDRLTLRGVESQGDQEFLVVGSFLPPRVNIVSHTQIIAFSELLHRLEQIKSDKPEAK